MQTVSINFYQLIIYIYILVASYIYFTVADNEKVFLISNHLPFSPLILLQLILVPYCCLFCVPSSDLLDIFIGTFSLKIHAPRSLKKKSRSSRNPPIRG